jgi:signal transduction histidine kinase
LYGSVLALAVHTVVSIAFRPTGAWTAHLHGITAYQVLSFFGDVLQAVILASVLAVLIRNALRTDGHVRMFWAMLAVGIGLWLSGQMEWIWYEVIVRSGVPQASIGDVLIFMHLVPMMAALAMIPHRVHTRGTPRLDWLDLLSLALWWMYLYTLVVMPWSHVWRTAEPYGTNFNVLYVCEHVVFLALLGGMALKVHQPWRKFYFNLLGAAALYAVTSFAINYMIDAKTYYTGSLYDLPLIASMLWFGGAAIFGGSLQPSQQIEPVRPQKHTVLPSRLAMVAVLSLPCMAYWALNDTHIPAPVRKFRIATTLLAMIMLGLLAFLKQSLLDYKLVRLLRTSEQNYTNLKRMQAQLVQTEKLAALGQLVGGAAHELNNPLTAIIGYSDLLSESNELSEEKQNWVAKIGQQARRTRDIVADLLTFSRQIPTQKDDVPINSLVLDAIEMCQFELPQHTRIETNLGLDIPHVNGDSNQLVQLCFHIIGNAIDALNQVGGGVVTVSTRSENGSVVIEFADTGPGVQDAQRIFDPFYSTKPLGKGAGLGLSACYGIVQAHKGQIWCENRVGGGARFVVTLPATPLAMTAVTR